MLSRESNFQASEEPFNYFSFEFQQEDVRLKQWKKKTGSILNYLNKKLQAIQIEGIKSEDETCTIYPVIDYYTKTKQFFRLCEPVFLI